MSLKQLNIQVECYVQTSVYSSVEAGTRLLHVSASDVECANSSCITYSLEPADNNSSFVVDSHSGWLLRCHVTLFNLIIVFVCRKVQRPKIKVFVGLFDHTVLLKII